VKIRHEIRIPGPVQYSSEALHIEYELEIPKGMSESEFVTRAVRDFKANLSSSTQPAHAAASPNPPKPDLSQILSPEQVELVDQKQVGEIFVVKPKNWLRDGLWDAIHDRIQGAGGKWISAGKESHWQIPVK
jgi:hypothetical protein